MSVGKGQGHRNILSNLSFNEFSGVRILTGLNHSGAYTVFTVLMEGRSDKPPFYITTACMREEELGADDVNFTLHLRFWPVNNLDHYPRESSRMGRRSALSASLSNACEG